MGNVISLSDKRPDPYDDYREGVEHLIEAYASSEGMAEAMRHACRRLILSVIAADFAKDVQVREDCSQCKNFQGLLDSFTKFDASRVSITTDLLREAVKLTIQNIAFRYAFDTVSEDLPAHARSALSGVIMSLVPEYVTATECVISPRMTFEKCRLQRASGPAACGRCPGLRR